MKALLTMSMICVPEYPGDFFLPLLYSFILSIVLLFALNWLANKFCNMFEYDFDYARITFWQGASILLYIVILSLLW